MPDRKHTPDVLGEILGEVAAGEPPAVAASTPRPPARRSTRPDAEAANSKPRAQNSEPLCWEHRLVSFQNYRGWRPRYVDGVELAGWMAGPFLHDYLDQMGAEGWEAAGLASGHPFYGSADSYQVIFKRPKP